MAAPTEDGRRSLEIRRVLKEALLVVVAGVGIGLVANFISPRGLSLTRDYFPPTRATTGIPSATSDPGHIVTGSQPDSSNGPPMASVAARLRDRGLQLVSEAEVEQFFRDPQREQELIVFVDARDDRHYQEGHIPGAFQFDRYYPEKHLPAVLPACLQAAKVIVYCAGGTCEDSEFAALSLLEAGVPRDRIYVYAEGMTGWSAKSGPLEIGARNSGLQKAAKP